MKTLVIAPNPEIREILADALKETPLKVELETNMEGASAAVDSIQPDLLLFASQRDEGRPFDLCYQCVQNPEMCERLRDSEKKFAAFIRQSAYGYAEIDLEGTILFTNQRAIDMLGYAPGETMGEHFSKFLDPGELVRAWDDLKQTLIEPFATPQEFQARAKDGSSKTLEINAIPIYRDGQPCGFQLTLMDTSQRRQAERAVRHSEMRLRGLVETIPDFVLILDRDATIRFLNRTTQKEKPEDAVGDSALNYLKDSFHAKMLSAVGAVFAGESLQTFEFQAIDGLWYDCRIAPLVEDDVVCNALVVATDITEGKKSQEAIKQEQQVLRQMLDLHERERQLVAYEIHDGFAQKLAGAQLNFEAARQMREVDEEKAEKGFETAMRLLNSSLDETRRLISGLRPPILDEFGIVAAVNYLIHESQTHFVDGKLESPDIEFVHDLQPDRLAPPLETAVFRIVQQALANACLHSQSNKITVKIVRKQEALAIEVRDWGIGFEEDKVCENTFGLRGIRERTRLLGGEIRIDTAPGQGTLIAVNLPLVQRF